MHFAIQRNTIQYFMRLGKCDMHMTLIHILGVKIIIGDCFPMFDKITSSSITHQTNIYTYTHIWAVLLVNHVCTCSVACKRSFFLVLVTEEISGETM